MNKKLVVILVVILFCLSGCFSSSTNPEKDIEEPTTTSQTKAVEEEKGHQKLKKKTIKSPQLSLNWMSVDLPEAGLKNLTIQAVEYGRVVDSEHSVSGLLPVYIFSDYEIYASDSIYHDSYLAVATDNKILLEDLSLIVGCYGETMYLQDVDGDGFDEIIIQQLVAMSGGAGGYFSRIFKVENEKIKEIFPLTDDNRFDTGFTNFLKDGFLIEISNNFTGYKKTIDYSKDGSESPYFDKKGNVVEQGEISCDSFYEFIPKDVDNDGVYEIVCLQYVSLYGHSDHIGDAKSILKFNKKTQQFEVIKAEFIQKDLLS